MPSIAKFRGMGCLDDTFPKRGRRDLEEAENIHSLPNIFSSNGFMPKLPFIS